MNTQNKSHDWCEEIPRGVVLHIKAQPKASKNQIVGLHGDPPRLKVRVAALPVDGKANILLLKFLSALLEMPVSHLKLVRGEASKDKDILCQGISLKKVKRILLKDTQMSLLK